MFLYARKQSTTVSSIFEDTTGYRRARTTMVFFIWNSRNSLHKPPGIQTRCTIPGAYPKCTLSPVSNTRFWMFFCDKNNVALELQRKEAFSFAAPECCMKRIFTRANNASSISQTAIGCRHACERQRCIRNTRHKPSGRGDVLARCTIDGMYPKRTLSPVSDTPFWMPFYDKSHVAVDH